MSFLILLTFVHVLLSKCFLGLQLENWYVYSIDCIIYWVHISLESGHCNLLCTHSLGPGNYQSIHWFWHTGVLGSLWLLLFHLPCSRQCKGILSAYITNIVNKLLSNVFMLPYFVICRILYSGRLISWLNCILYEGKHTHRVLSMLTCVARSRNAGIEPCVQCING